MGTSSTMTRKPRTSGEGVRHATGRDRDAWFALLDTWGAAGRPYREIADWRPAGVRPDGTFSVTASKTVGAPVERLFEAFVDAKLRKRWLPGGPRNGEDQEQVGARARTPARHRVRGEDEGLLA